MGKITITVPDEFAKESKEYAEKTARSFSGLVRYGIKKVMELESTKTTSKLCALCGGTKNLINHHTDYKRDKTITLCQSCHIGVHRSSELTLLYPFVRNGDTPVEKRLASNKKWREQNKDKNFKIVVRCMLRKYLLAYGHDTEIKDIWENTIDGEPE